MGLRERRLSLSSFFMFFFKAVTILTLPTSSSSFNNFVFGNCAIEKYIPNSPYDSNVNLLLNHLIGSSTFAAYNNITVLSSTPLNTIYGLYQCRGDLTPNNCVQCVSGAINRLRTVCSDACGGVLQLEGCFVKYDNERFFGVEDKTVLVKKCGAPIGTDLEALIGVDAALAYLVTGGGTYRSGEAGDVQSVAQCIGDLSVMECQDCIFEAIGQLKSACGFSAWGDLFFAKCYARFTRSSTHIHENRDGDRDDGNGDGSQDSKGNYKQIKKILKTNKTLAKTLAITIGSSSVATVSLTITIYITLKKRGKTVRPPETQPTGNPRDEIVIELVIEKPEIVVEPKVIETYTCECEFTQDTTHRF